MDFTQDVKDKALEIALASAKAKPESYYSEPFTPHQWVIDAICLALCSAPNCDVGSFKTPEQKLMFAEWILELNQLADKKYGLGENHAGTTGADAWLEYYISGHSPEAAIDEDMSNE